MSEARDESFLEKKKKKILLGGNEFSSTRQTRDSPQPEEIPNKPRHQFVKASAFFIYILFLFSTASGDAYTQAALRQKNG